MTFDVHLAVRILPLLLRGLVVTIEATLAGFVFALAGGLVLALGFRAKSWPARMVSRGLVEFLRNTPLLVQLYFIFYGLPLIGFASPHLSLVCSGWASTTARTSPKCTVEAWMPCLLDNGKPLRLSALAALKHGGGLFCPRPFRP